LEYCKVSLLAVIAILIAVTLYFNNPYTTRSAGFDDYGYADSRDDYGRGYDDYDRSHGDSRVGLLGSPNLSFSWPLF